MLCKFLLYSKVTQLHTHTHTSFFKFFSIMVYPRILNIVLCAIQEDLVVYLHLSLKKTKIQRG